MFIKDPKTGKKSVTLTAFVVGLLVANVKLLLSGVSVGSFVMSPFSGMDFAAVVGAVGAIYAARKHTDKDNSSNG